MSGDERIDLSALDPEVDGSLERMMRQIGTRAAPELARSAAARSPFVVLAGWALPSFAAAAVLAAVSLLGLSVGSPEARTPLRGVPEELGLTGPVVEWVTEDRAPTPDDLLLAMEYDY